MLRKTQAIDYENSENLNSPLLEKKKSLELIKNKFMIDLKDNSKKKIFKLKL